MALPPDVEARFDEQARLARVQFEEHWKRWSVTEVAQWWDRWCASGRTNHDRLGRILMDVTGVRHMRPEPAKGNQW